jgi:hypothetical protein
MVPVWGAPWQWQHGPQPVPGRSRGHRFRTPTPTPTPHRAPTRWLQANRRHHPEAVKALPRRSSHSLVHETGRYTPLPLLGLPAPQQQVTQRVPAVCSRHQLGCHTGCRLWCHQRHCSTAVTHPTHTRPTRTAQSEGSHAGRVHAALPQSACYVCMQGPCLRLSRRFCGKRLLALKVSRAHIQMRAAPLPSGPAGPLSLQCTHAGHTLEDWSVGACPGGAVTSAA